MLQQDVDKRFKDLSLQDIDESLKEIDEFVERPKLGDGQTKSTELKVKENSFEVQQRKVILIKI